MRTAPGRAPRLARAAALAAALGGLACAGAPKPAWEQPVPPPTENPVVQPGRLHRAELDNGLQVIVLEDPSLPRVVLGLTFRRGEASLPPEQAGLAGFTAELLERGAGERDAPAFAEAVDRLGAAVGASAGWDTLELSATGLSRDLDFLLGVLADMSLRPRFDPAEIERARGEVLAALERAKDDPQTLESWYGARALYPGHRFGLPVSGTPETVRGFDAAAVRRLHRAMLVPNGAILSVSGDVAADDVIARIRRAFGRWEPGPLPEPGEPPQREARERRVLIVDRPDLEQARIFVGHEGIARTAEDRIPVQLMNSVIGGSGFSSRMMDALRSQAGLTYSIYSYFDMRREPGPFVVSTFTRVPEVRRALDLVLAELERAKAEPPGEEELAWARPLAVGRFSMGLETSAAVVSGLVDLDVYGLPRDSLDTYRTRVAQTPAEEVAAAAKRHLHPERVAIVLVGPAEALEPQVADLGPVEVVTP